MTSFLNFYAAAVTAGSGNGVPAGVFFPRASLPGITAGEFADSETDNAKEAKSLFAIFSKAAKYQVDNSFTPLGISIVRDPAIGVSAGVATEALVTTVQWMADFTSASITMLPIPTTGTSSGVGDFAIKDIFADAAIVSAGGAISGEGVLVSFTELARHACPTLTDIDTGEDNRIFFASLASLAVEKSVLRSTTVASAITAKVKSATPTGINLSTTQLNAANPTVGLTEADRPTISVFRHTYTVTVERADNLETEKTEVHVIVTPA
jgi:hypothetical protein